MTAPMTPLVQRLTPCGPVLDERAARHGLEPLAEAAEEAGWSGLFEAARPALAPVIAAAPYLAGLARRDPAGLRRTLESAPEVRLEEILGRAAAAGSLPLGEGRRELRRAKQAAHLLTALADLGGAWDLDQVTGAITQLADACLAAALRLAAAEEAALGRLTAVGDGERGPVPGFFCLALGKMGAFELNYSSDIDVTCFYDPALLPLADGVECGRFTERFTSAVARILQDRTPDGYVFRVDLRLRPDPSSTPPAVPVDAAFEYYESVGQNWERAAFIKARPAAGDLVAARAFLDELQAFIWRRNLDFAAIADIHSIKRQIHTFKVDERISAKGMDLKLGRGGIREVEFYVQTQQLILGGRRPELRSNRTLDALAALSEAGHVTAEAAAEMAEAYRRLRDWEHRVQMVADEQTHRLPESDNERRRIAVLSGEGDLRRFDAAVTRTLKTVNARYGELFPEEEQLSSRFGSLVFTGVDDDPATLETLSRMGFSQPAQVSSTIRGWHHGRIAATRTERGRELFTRLAPRLLEAAHASGAPDSAFIRFSDFFSTLTSGVQVQSLFLAQPKLFELVVEVMAFAPELARTLARRPSALDALLDPAFFEPFDPREDRTSLSEAIAASDGFEGAMDAARRFHAEQAFRIGVQVISGTASAEDAGRAFANLADVCIEQMAAAAKVEVERQAGPFPGQVAVVALGKCGSREMTAGSDLDLMTLYRADAPDAVSSLKEWSAETWFSRFTQRMIAALSAPTAAGTLYDVDLRLRPSGTKGPVAVSVGAFRNYYLGGEAETWEFLALTRARVVWSSDPQFAAEAADLIAEALSQPGKPDAETAADVRAMRRLMDEERPAAGDWDMKLSPGGLVDIEFVAQFLQLIAARDGHPVEPNTGAALAVLAARPGADAARLESLRAAWVLQQDLSQLLKVALRDQADPSGEPAAFRRRLARAGGAREFRGLTARLRAARAQARAAYEALVRA
jgi:glutamate-ammonia-ligase adenylyltransferase